MIRTLGVDARIVDGTTAKSPTSRDMSWHSDGWQRPESKRIVLAGGFSTAVRTAPASHAVNRSIDVRMIERQNNFEKYNGMRRRGPRMIWTSVEHRKSSRESQ